MNVEILSIDTVKRIADLEKRINKAVSYLEDSNFTDYPLENREELLDILKGSDNND